MSQWSGSVFVACALCHPKHLLLFSFKCIYSAPANRPTFTTSGCPERLRQNPCSIVCSSGCICGQVSFPTPRLTCSLWCSCSPDVPTSLSPSTPLAVSTCRSQQNQARLMQCRLTILWHGIQRPSHPADHVFQLRPSGPTGRQAVFSLARPRFWQALARPLRPFSGLPDRFIPESPRMRHSAARRSWRS